LGNCLSLDDPKILAVALEGLYNILLCGQKYFHDVNGFNSFAI